MHLTNCQLPRSVLLQLKSVVWLIFNVLAYWCCRSWIIDYKGIATKVKCAGLSPAYQIKDCGANRECPKCHYRIDNSDVSRNSSRSQIVSHLATCFIPIFIQHSWCSVIFCRQVANRWLEDTSRDDKITSRWLEAHVEMIKLLLIL